MDNFIIIAVIAAIVGGALFYVIKAKKKGIKCIGCPDGAKCMGNCSCCSSCGSTEETNS